MGGGPDFAYPWTAEARLYVDVVIDLLSRKATGWSMHAQMDSQRVIDALIMASRRHRKPVALLDHPDQGSQVTREDFQRLLADVRSAWISSRGRGKA